MANSKTGMTEPKRPSGDLGSTLIGILAAGVAGGALLIGGAKMLGEKILEIQIDRYERLEKQREADKEEVRRITAVEADHTTEHMTE